MKKNKVKKIIVAVLSSLMIVSSLVGCGAKGN